MKNIYSLLRGVGAASLLAALLAACGSTPARVDGGALVGFNGMTLYTFDNDKTPGKSVCNGPCAVNWPPLMASDTANPYGEYTVITRDDGKKQWAYKNKPLYFWIRDKIPGDKTGDGFNKVWRVAVQ